MFDFFSQSADGVIILSYIMALVLFFLYGPQKVYESFFGALLGVWLYLFIFSITYITPDTTRAIFFGNLLLERRDMLLWCTNAMTLFLFFFAPMSMGIHAGWVIRWSLWFIFKILILSAFFVLFGVVLVSAVSGRFTFMNQAPLFSQTIFQNPFFTSSYLYNWIIERTYWIVLVTFTLAFYKIIFSHWVTKMGLLLGAMYVKWDEIFGKKTFDQGPISLSGDDTHGHDIHGGGDGHDWH